MRKITESAVDAFMSATPFKQGNTEVVVRPNVTVLCLHNNEIAYRYNDPEMTLSVCTRGWNTSTTRERLNGIPGVNVRTVKGALYLNGQKWNGALIDIKQ